MEAKLKVLIGPHRGLRTWRQAESRRHKYVDNFVLYGLPFLPKLCEDLGAGMLKTIANLRLSNHAVY